MEIRLCNCQWLLEDSTIPVVSNMVPECGMYPAKRGQPPHAVVVGGMQWFWSSDVAVPHAVE